MKDPLAGIVAMLETGGPEQQVAAAQVLAWLKPRTASVVKALGSLAARGEAFVQPYAVEALGAIGSSPALAQLIPLLHVEGRLRDVVARHLSKLGSSGESVLIREFEKTDDDTRIVILEVLAQTRGATAIKTILGVLKNPTTGNIGESAAKHLLNEVQATTDPAEQAAIRSIVLSNLKRSPQKAPLSYRVHLLELVNAVKDDSCRGVFVTHSGTSHPPEVRAVALRALADFELTPAQMIKVVGFLGHDDFIHVVGPSLEVLTDFVPSGAPMANTLAQLLEMPRPEVRVFALRGLGNYRTLSAAKLLMPFLASPHAQVRAVAAEGLGANPEARPGLIKLLLEGRDLEEVGRPVEALAALAPELTRLQVKKLVARFIKLVEADDPVRELFQRVLRRTKAEFVMPLLLENAKRLRQKRAYGEALRVLQVLATGADAEMNGDVRYEIAVTTLLKRGHVPETSEGDSVVGHFCHLIDENYELLARIKKERVLEVSDVLYLGQRFVERHDADRGFGTELLNWLIKKEPEAKESVQAMQKLKVEGLA